MSKSDDDLKLDINEIFGASEILPDPDRSNALNTPQVNSEIAAETTIKFNDLSNEQAVEPMVITIQSRIKSVESSISSAPIETPQSQNISTRTEEAKPVSKEGSPSIVQVGTSRKTSDPQDFFKVYDHFREVFLEELKDSAGLRKTCIMLVKTFEAAREKYPEVFRNANWDSNGNLLEDGSLNTQRMLDNQAAFDSQKADMTLDTALIFLLNIRLQAVEKGLGFDLANKIKMILKKWCESSIQESGFGREDPKIFKRLSNYLL